METFAQIIEAFGNSKALAVALDIPYSHARVIKTRGSIPVERWERLVRAAADRHIEGVTFEALAKIAASRAPEPARKGDHASGEAA